MITIFGIKNCDTVKKALKWLEREGVAYSFHDFRKDGLDEVLAQSFITALGIEAVINKRGTTWRKLDSDEQKSVDASSAAALLVAHDALVKRPVWQFADGSFMIAFGKKEQAYIAEKLAVEAL